MSAPTDDQRAAAREWITQKLLPTEGLGMLTDADYISLASLLATRERAAFESGRQSVFDSFKLLPVPSSGNAGQVCAHSDVETFTGGWRCRTCGYSWAWSVTP
jgi:hypothetical protein